MPIPLPLLLGGAAGWGAHLLSGGGGSSNSGGAPNAPGRALFVRMDGGEGVYVLIPDKEG